ncbi:MAG: GLPGLI family protein [Saprospiraceae bacterium]
MFYSGQKTKFQNSEESAEDDDYGYSWRKEMYFQTRDFENNTILDGIYTLGKNYIIEDTLWTQDWKILNDMKEVAGHICMNAQWVDTLKQQTVIAWFALDIPLSGGPDKYCGLPGMILEIDVNNGAMVMSADLIEEKNVDQEMELPKKLKGKHVSQAEYDAIVKQHIEDKRKAKEPYFWGIRY